MAICLVFAVLPATSPAKANPIIVGRVAVQAAKPVVRPFVDDALRLGKPYAEAIRLAKPYLDDATRLVRPYYDGAVRMVGPVYDDALSAIQPHLDDATRLAEKVADDAGRLASPYVEKSVQLTRAYADEAVVISRSGYQHVVKRLGFTKPIAHYNRATFGVSTRTRGEFLAMNATGSGRVVTDGTGRVIHGRWIDQYTGRTIMNAKNVDIDHVITLQWAWRNGAHKWSPGKLRAFANDPKNLAITSRTINRSKGARGLSEWKPDNRHLARQYELRWKRLLKEYGL